MANSKKQKQKQNSIPVRKVAGYRLSVWCKGGLDDSGQPITAPWKLVYSPYWMDGYTKKPAAPGWNNTPILAYMVDGIVDYDKPEAAFEALSSVSEEDIEIGTDELKPRDIVIES